MQAEESRIELLLGQMTLDEQASMSAGSGLWFSTPVDRLGIPAFKMSDGPNGVRGDGRTRGITSACYPVGTAMGATWNRTLIGAVGDALAEECRAKDVDVLLGPTINLHRHPLAGRNFECYSEDPYLSAEMAVALIRRVQAGGVACCPKHFVCNDSEFERYSISSNVDARTLRELYLYPFEAVVKRAHAWSLMSAYNKVNGVFASANEFLLSYLLKGEWGFDGVVISDWGGTNSMLEPANAGLDLEMPGPARHLGKRLADAVRAGAVPESVVADKVRRQLRLMQRTGRLDRGEARAERPLDRAEDRALIRRVGAEAMVLLRNEGMLPLTEPRRIALIGPNAVEPMVLGGGSSTLSPHHVVTPLEGLRSAFPDAEIELVRGCVNFKHLPVITADQCRVPDSDRAGFRVSFFNGEDCAGEPVLVRHPREGQLLWFGRVSEAVEDQFCARIESEFAPVESGRYRFSLMSAGLSRLSIDGRVVVDNWTAQARGESFFGSGSSEVIGVADLTAGEPVRLEIIFRRIPATMAAGIRIGLAPPSLVDDLDAAERAAAAADVAIIVAGLTGEWESEGHDRTDLELPGAQSALITRVSAVNPHTVVAINAGCPIRTGDWLGQVNAVLQIWYPGQEFGHALADVLCGKVDPSGRLPTTFPKRLEDTPAFAHYPGANGAVDYGEGLFVGYRHYDREGIEPEFPFGFGLSYTQFRIDSLEVDKARPGTNDGVRVRARVTNVGSRTGQTVAQLYLGDQATPAPVAKRQLRGFEKVELAPGEAITVEFALTPRDFAHFDVASGGWTVTPGPYRIEVGQSSRDLPQSLVVHVG